MRTFEAEGRRRLSVSQIVSKTFSWMNNRLFWTVMVIAFGSGFQHGYHTGFTNILENMFREWIERCLNAKRNIKQPPDEVGRHIWATFVSIFSVGGIIGGMMVAIFANRLGYKRGLFYNNFILCLGLAIMMISYLLNSFVTFIVGRLIVGIHAGLSGGLCQMFLVDIAPYEIRGVVCGFYQLSITFGILFAEFFGFALGTLSLWPYLLLISLMVAIAQLLSLQFIPESPKYLLIIKEDETAAEEALRWLMKSEDVQDELLLIKEEDNIVKKQRTVYFKRLFMEPMFRMPLLICLVLQMSNQLSGINAVGMYFSANYFKMLGLKELTAEGLTIGNGLLNVVITIIALPLLDSWGRRNLLLVAFVGLSLVSAGVPLFLKFKDNEPFLKYATVGLVYAFTMFFAPAVGTIPWFITVELFFQTARASAVTVAVTINWMANFLVGQTFKDLKEVIHFYSFLVFAVVDIFFFGFTYLYVPETAGKTPQELINICKS